MDFPPPECHGSQSFLCSEKDWRHCAACGRQVCLIHAELITVLYSGKKPTGADEVCHICIEALFEAGEVSMGNPYQYVNRR
jgi:hypothetical protein